MQVGEWLPSERVWIDRLADRVLAGEVLLVRSMPRWGLSAACESVVQLLGNSAVRAEGRAITELNQKAIRESIDRDIRKSLDRDGYAQLIFDDYGRAIRRSQGGALHSLLYRLLIDSQAARDTGALLIARSGDELDLNFSGSPMISRAKRVSLPILTPSDADVLGMGLSDLQRLSGQSTWLARRFMNVDLSNGKTSVLEYLNNDRRPIIEAMPARATECFLGASPASQADSLTREVLEGFGFFDKNGEFNIATMVLESKLLGELKLQNPGWPTTMTGSVQRFAEFLAGVEDALWVDRYLFHDPPRVRNFIDNLRNSTSARLRLLVSDDKDRPELAHSISSALSGVINVEVRFMSRLDRRLLHDRHLVLPELHSGFVLPTARVILNMDEPGSSVSVPISTLAVNYGLLWGRGIRVFSTS